MKLTTAQQAKAYNIFKYTKQKLLKLKVAIWFNKLCKTKGLQPRYISLNTRGKSTRDHRTTQHATKYRISMEIKHLYKQKQHLNQRLYWAHLEAAKMYKGMWQHALIHIDETLNGIMEHKYHNLNEKIRILECSTQYKHRTYKQHNTPKVQQPRIINLTNKTLTEEQVNILNKGPQYAMESNPQVCINDIIIETESAIKNIEPKWQDTYRFMAGKHIKRIKEKYKRNPLHRHQIKIIKKLKMEMNRDGIKIMNADKSKAMVLIDSKQCLNKVYNFLKDNNIASIQKDPTTKFHKQIQKIIQLCPHLIDTRAHRFLTQMLPKASSLNVLIKTHKENMPIRPVINNKLAPSHKLAKYLNEKIHS